MRLGPLLGVSTLQAVPGLFTAVLIFLAFRFLARSLSAFFRAVEAGRVSSAWFHPDTAPATRRLVVVLLWLFAAVLAYPCVPGSGSEAFKAVSVFVGLVVSFGSGALVGQVMSGLALTHWRAFKPGEKPETRRPVLAAAKGPLP